MESADGELLPVAEPTWKRQRRESSARARFASLPSPPSPPEQSGRESSHPWSPVRASSRIHEPQLTVLNTASPHNPLLTNFQRDELSKYIAADSAVLESTGFEELVKLRRGKSDFGAKVKNIKHKAARYLHHLEKRGANARRTPDSTLEPRAVRGNNQARPSQIVRRTC
jgi:hypothetical protein